MGQQQSLVIASMPLLPAEINCNSMGDWTDIEGSPYPLGATYVAHKESCNFALYSEHATGLTLLLYSELNSKVPTYQYRFDHLRNKTAHVWHCRIPLSKMPDARYYAYHVEGPFDPATGNRFDAQKVLLDPYARSVVFPDNFSREASSRPGSNAGMAPLGMLPSRAALFDWDDDRQPLHYSDAIIYELHVKGFTARTNSGVCPDNQGTYLGLVEKIPYLKELGVTMVELMPVHQYDPQEGNYWGYMTLNFFSPQQSYAKNKVPGAQINEFRSMIKELHKAGIEVILDVVYNHTTEIDEKGPTYSFRGIDNSSYYLLAADRSRYLDDTRTGNVFNSANHGVRRLIVDSIIYWTREMHVDGFRFDLATVFTRDKNGRTNLDDPPVISEISALQEFASTRLIAEAWDPVSYQLGRNFPGTTWLQWNGKFRDDVRAFIRGDRGAVSALMTRLYGSDDLFPDSLAEAYHPYQSINYITSHDGFCLYDLVSYNFKHNEANGHDNDDGTDYNLSWNCGWEGDRDVPPDVLELRKRQIKNFCCVLFLANGTPMFRAGDEFMNTQGGNNNPYNQDNETSWLNWDLLEKNHDIFRFFKGMIAFRKTHPTLSRSRFWRDDIKWYGVGKNVDYGDDSHTLAFCLHGSSQNDHDIYVMMSAYCEDLPFVIQEGQPGEWRRVVDTSLAPPLDFSEEGSGPVLTSLRYIVKSRSVVILIKRAVEKAGV
jgi:isoamylase